MGMHRILLIIIYVMAISLAINFLLTAIWGANYSDSPLSYGVRFLIGWFGVDTFNWLYEEPK